MLELGAPFAVFGNHRPPVIPDLIIDASQGKHRLDREGHAFFDHGVVIGSIKVRNDQSAMECRINSMPGEIFDDSISESTSISLDYPSYHVDLPPRLHGGDRPVEGFARAIYEELGLFADLSDGVRGVGISMYAVDESSDIDIEDVALFHSGGIGDAMTDNFI